MTAREYLNYWRFLIDCPVDTIYGLLINVISAKKNLGRN